MIRNDNKVIGKLNLIILLRNNCYINQKTIIDTVISLLEIGI